MGSQDKRTQSSLDLVGYSRAGDIFHYRWAARRCLRLLDFNTPLEKITIEGSNQPQMGGEFVIDTAEYSVDDTKKESIEYFQLKHTTVQLDKPFTLSGFETTIRGFAERFKSHREVEGSSPNIKFTIITNRPVSRGMKDSIAKIASGESGGETFDKTISKYTSFSGEMLSTFCQRLCIVDNESGYDDQKYELYKQITKLTNDTSDTAPLRELVELVMSRVEPKSARNFINKDDVLKCFGLTSERDLFPAPPLFEKLATPIDREQSEKLYQKILDPITSFLIIEATAGTGKTIICNQLVDYFSDGSLAIAYDCFGNGGYRRKSEPRHRIRDAYTQVANQLAQEGLCEPLILTQQSQEDRLTKGFLERLSQAVEKLRKTNIEAVLAIFFDAVDNAEMAAQEAGENCFANKLLLEELPDGCKVVYFSRPERVCLFSPSELIPRVELQPFNIVETCENLRSVYPVANEQEAIEFYRLTGGNPRVQANALALGKKNVRDILTYFGSSGKTVDDLIEEQLNTAVNKIKDLYPNKLKKQVENICTGLASLPPFIPLEVLAVASGTDILALKSFITELGRPLWLTDNYVQFRDETTEYWFIKNYAGNIEQIENYVQNLKPLTNRYSYVAEAFPSLLLKAGKYEELINLALSEDKLPIDNPVDARSIQVYRLQFAFKAALRKEHFFDACRIALRAGEETAGNERQRNLLSHNFDLIPSFLSEQQIMKMAHQREISGEWDGSENTYSAALLSSMEECEGEARSYLRSGINWLHSYFESRKKESDTYEEDKLQDSDVLAMLFSVYHLDGEKAAVDFIKSWQPDELIYRVVRDFSERLVDFSEFEVLKKMALYGSGNPSLVIAINEELLKVGLTPDKESLISTLDNITGTNRWLEKPNDIYDAYRIRTSAFLSLFESCILNSISNSKLLLALNYYVPEPSIHTIKDNFFNENREIFFRKIAVYACIEKNYDLMLDDLIPKSWKEADLSQNIDESLKNAKQIINAYLPWYMVRAKLLAGLSISLDEQHKLAATVSSKSLSNRYLEFDPVPFEISKARFFNLMLAEHNVEQELQLLEGETIKFSFSDRLSVLRSAYRVPHLKDIADTLEDACYQSLKGINEEGAENHANDLIALARAVLASSKESSEFYFEEAVKIVSRFGDEAVERWEAVVSIAKHRASFGIVDPETAYRFMRCAELIGNTVAREKHWDRYDAMATCCLLHPASAFAIASRWVDRDVGWDDRTHRALLETALQTNAISPSSAWALSVFTFEYRLIEFADLCIDNENDVQKKQTIFSYLVDDYRRQGVTGSLWLNIAKLADKHNLKHDELTHIELLAIEDIKEKPSDFTANNDVEELIDCEEIYDDINFPTSHGLHEAITKFKEQRSGLYFNTFWRGISSRLSNDNFVEYLNIISSSDYLDLYDVYSAIKNIPDHFKTKPSMKKVWKTALEKIAANYPKGLINSFHRNRVLNIFEYDEAVVDTINKGVVKGLTEHSSLEIASTFYNFASSFAQKLKKSEIESILDFALLRFELHIEEDYADGPWRDDISAPANPISSLAGYVWASLGSPEAGRRWSAAHVVRRLYRLGCEQEIEELIKWMDHKPTIAFIGNGFPFYFFHAKQYLLIALARCAIDDCSILKRYYQIFQNIALSASGHILIQKYAADIALAILKDSSNQVTQEVTEKLTHVAKSPFELELTDKYYEHRDTPWHKNKVVDTSLELSLGWDFDQYWFEPLGNVFGVSSKHTQELAAEVILKDWALPFEEPYIRDPRRGIWNSRQNRKTWHSHGGYPETDDYTFYLSYHSMMVVASKLLKTMTVICPHYRKDNEWEDWLSRHLVTQSDGLWLSDNRGYFPTTRREWLENHTKDEWRWLVQPHDFLEMLLNDVSGETWLNIAGSWNEFRNYQNESIEISSRLLPSWASPSLQKTIQFDTTGRIGLEYFGDAAARFFDMKDWYGRDEVYYNASQLDPYFGSLDYPPILPNKWVLTELSLSSSEGRNAWYDPTSTDIVLLSQLWSGDKPEREHDKCSRGNRLQASLAFLKKMLNKLGMDLILQVSISRELTSYSREEDNETKYPPPYRKIYILTKNGELRDANSAIVLREKTTKKL